jgi:hypothetical protein
VLSVYSSSFQADSLTSSACSAVRPMKSAAFLLLPGVPSWLLLLRRKICSEPTVTPTYTMPLQHSHLASRVSASWLACMLTLDRWS